MDEGILRLVSPITPEEQKILDGQTCIDRALYMQGRPDVIHSRKLLEHGKLITLRPHTRFIHFPQHTHDYVEMVYMCSGSTVHIVNGKSIELRQGELLLLNQGAKHEVCKAGVEDIAINIIILPAFFNQALADLDEEETPLRRFLVDCLCEQNSLPGYLHFRVSNIKPIQNLVENLLWSLLEETVSRRKVRQMTMSVLMLQLAAHTDALSVPSKEDAAVFQVLHYAESAYRDGSLTEIAEKLGFDICWLSREIKRKTGKTYTQIVQEKRMAQAAFLLKNTNINVAEIAVSVGYDNVSYFHRLFAASFGCSPKKYRDQ